MRAMTKRILSLALTLAMVLSLCLTVQAKGSVTVTLDGRALELTAPAYVDGNGRTQVPVTIGPQLGLTYQQKEGEVTFVKGEASLTFRDGEKQAGSMTMDTAADLSGSVGYVPLVYLARAFGFQLIWNSGTRTAALTTPVEGFQARDLAEIEAPTHDYSESNQLPLTGYFKASLTGEFAGREVRYYIPDTAVIRPYYHFIAVPDGVNADQFLVDSGWKQVADETGECLFVLLPDQTTYMWGDVEQEKDYIAAAKAYHSGNGAYFTTFGEFYLVGYGAGAAPLEAWAAENPHLIISQAYLNGTTYGLENLRAAGEESYGWKHMTDGDIRDRDGDGINERVDENGNKKILYQMADRLDQILNPDKGSEAGLLTKGDMPLPTWLVNAESDDSLTYWKQVNRADSADASVTALGSVPVSGQVYSQKEDTWATEYAGRISKVVDLETAADTVSYDFTRALRDEMTDYTRYDNSISYGNGLTYRLDYTDIQVERFSSRDKRAVGTVSGPDLNGNEVEAEITIQALTLDDGYVTDVLLYVPETAGTKDIPVVVVWHGGSQTGHLFMDSTAWWQTAAAEGFALALPTRTNHNQGTSSDYDLPIFDKVVQYLKNDGRFDMGRIYTTGQSMGSVATIALAENRASQLAAVISSNAGGPSRLSGGDAIPAGLVVGEGNYADRGIPGYTADTSYPEDDTSVLVRSTEAAAAGADIYWDAAKNLKGATNHNMNDWIAYFTDANGLGEDSLSDVIVYSGGNALNGGHDDAQGSLSDWESNNARYRTWKWYNEDDIPVMTYIFSLYEAHNCIPGFRPLMWDFLEHYSVETAADGTVTRYYSASGFEQDDAVVIQ